MLAHFRMGWGGALKWKYQFVMNLWGERMENLPKIRCSDCNRLLFYGFVKYVSIKCPKCGRIQTFKGQQTMCDCCLVDEEGKNGNYNG